MMLRKLKWLYIWAGFQLLKSGLRYRITNGADQWLQPFKTNSEPVSRKQWILDYSASKKILHVGFADAPYTKERINNGSLLHLQLKKKTQVLLGIDTDDKAVNIYREMTGDLLVKHGTLDQINEVIFQDFELIIVGEVLEHIMNPSSLIDPLEEKMKKGQQLLISVPNYISFDNISAGLHNTESVHPDHHWYFSPYTLMKKFKDELWIQKKLIFGYYSEKKPNFIQRSFPALADCIILVLERK